MSEFMQKQLDGRFHGLLVLAVGVAIGIGPSAADAQIVSDITISVDIFGLGSETTFEVRDSGGTILESGTFTPVFLDCGVAGDLVAAINPTGPGVTVTDETPGFCFSGQGGNVRVTMDAPGECTVCSGPDPCAFPGDIIGPAPKVVGALTFNKETSAVPSASPSVLIGLTGLLFVAGSVAVRRMRGRTPLA
jgi:hypothetical protein